MWLDLFFWALSPTSQAFFDYMHVEIYGENWQTLAWNGMSPKDHFVNLPHIDNCNVHVRYTLIVIMQASWHLNINGWVMWWHSSHIWTDVHTFLSSDVLMGLSKSPSPPPLRDPTLGIWLLFLGVLPALFGLLRRVAVSSPRFWGLLFSLIILICGENWQILAW
jgi:hypothetical protein